METREIIKLKAKKDAISAVHKRIYMLALTSYFDVKYPIVDKRTIYGKYFVEFYKQFKKDFDYELKKSREISEKIKHRRKLKEIVDPLSLTIQQRHKLVFDYFKNKDEIKYINNDHLRFKNGRGHYAKTATDFKDIILIKKWHKKYL